jgi:2-polyprenyl-3-methyl-5-hydroxy-6-metoxy-1,4-benzoquinol methylase
MAVTNEWQIFFDNTASSYNDEEYAKPWKEEVDFMEEVFNLAPGSRLLDVGCGTGRHSVELARRGYQVTGIDFSAGMLNEGRKAAQQAGVEVEWIQCDATQYQAAQPFDGAICMLEAAFALFVVGQDPIEKDFAILRNVNRALKPDARFMLNAPNGYRMIRQFTQADVESGLFDPVTMVNVCTLTWEAADSIEHKLEARFRNYLPTEVAMYLRLTGFEVENMWGGTHGRHPINLDEYMFMVVARKVADVAEARAN